MQAEKKNIKKKKPLIVLINLLLAFSIHESFKKRYERKIKHTKNEHFQTTINFPSQ